MGNTQAAARAREEALWATDLDAQVAQQPLLLIVLYALLLQLILQWVGRDGRLSAEPCSA